MAAKFKNVLSSLRKKTPDDKALSAEDKQKMPILRNRDNELKLIKHIQDRLIMGQDERNARYERCSQIDVQLSGFVRLGHDDQQRMRDLLYRGHVKPVEHNLPLADAKLDDAVSYLMSVFAPDMQLFESAATAEKSEAAKALTGEINKQGLRAQYYREFTKVCQGAMRYNFAAITCYWDREQGWAFSAGASGVVSKQVGTVWQGNRIKTCDVYNFMFDSNVHPCDLPRLGEWYCEIDLISPFRAEKDAQDKKCFGIDRFWDAANLALVPPREVTFYRAPPTVRRDDAFNSPSTTNWVQAYRNAVGGIAIASSPGIERWKYVTWIRPADFGLSTTKELELWYIEVMQCQYITLAVRIEDTHGMLPCAIAAPIEDDLGNNQRTYAERLLPLQNFSSFLLNSHQAATRKALYGVTVYDQNLFPGLDLSKEDMTSAIIPMRGSRGNVDIDKAFRHWVDAPETGQNVEMIEKVDAIMQVILPTDLYRQVADLERATLYQAAATVQTGNRRSLKIARMISNQCLEVLKIMMIYNIYANLTVIDYIDDQGKSQQLAPSQFLNLGLENYISNGLKGIDRLMIITAFKEVLAMILQSQQAIQELDIVKLLAYFFNLIGEAVDLNEFRKALPQRVVDSTLNNGAPPSPQPAPVTAQ